MLFQCVTFPCICQLCDVFILLVYIASLGRGVKVGVNSPPRFVIWLCHILILVRPPPKNKQQQKNQKKEGERENVTVEDVLCCSMYMDGLVKMWFCWNSNSRLGHSMHTEKKKVYIQQWNHHFQSSDEISPTHPHTSSCYKFFVHKMLMQIILCVYWLDSFLVFW